MTPTATVPDASPSVPTPDHFQSFKDLCLNILSQSGNCAASRAAFSSSTSVSDLTQKFKLFWQGLCQEVPTQVISSFSAFYDQYRDEIRAAGVSFNEPLDLPGAYILVGSTTVTDVSPSVPATVPEVSPSGHSATVPDAFPSGSATVPEASASSLVIDSSSFTPPKVFIIGPALVTATGKVIVHCDHPDARVILRGHTRATIRRGTAECHDWSVCSCGDDAHITCYDSTTLYATALTDITDHGHLRIYR